MGLARTFFFATKQTRHNEIYNTTHKVRTQIHTHKAHKSFKVPVSVTACFSYASDFCFPLAIAVLEEESFTQHTSQTRSLLMCNARKYTKCVQNRSHTKKTRVNTLVAAANCAQTSAIAREAKTNYVHYTFALFREAGRPSIIRREQDKHQMHHRNVALPRILVYDLAYLTISVSVSVSHLLRPMCGSFVCNIVQNNIT